MNTRTSLPLAAAVFCIVCVAASADDMTPMNVKTGQWESTVTSQTSGQLPVPQDVLDKLTPEQRAKMEAALKARTGQGARTSTYKSCVTKEDLQKPFGSDQERKSCKQTVLNSSPTHQEIHMECEVAGGKQSGTFKVDAIDSGTAKGSLEMVASNGGRTMNINSTFSSQWLGPACTESK